MRRRERSGLIVSISLSLVMAAGLTLGHILLMGYPRLLPAVFIMVFCLTLGIRRLAVMLRCRRTGSNTP
ncbi:MAG: hypothetical protein KF713_04370 [Turneriella sp.]|nr:hypothetical protein [Turneriella sp.]